MTQQNLVSGRNHLTCAFLTSGHILGLSTRLSPSLTTSHPHIQFPGSYPPGSAYPSHIFILFHVTTIGTILQAQFQISHQWRLSTRLSLTITHFPHHLGLSSHRDPRSIIIQLSIHISQFHSFTFHMSMFLSHFLAQIQHVSISISYSNHKSSIYTIYILTSHHITIHA